ncbi:MAG: hypothetical protein P3X24_004810, partial [bacterium]|nr:hypothetical protein [bacterium]
SVGFVGVDADATSVGFVGGDADGTSVGFVGGDADGTGGLFVGGDAGATVMCLSAGTPTLRQRTDRKVRATVWLGQSCPSVVC